MKHFNATGIKPAYRRLVIDMSITLGLVLDFANAKPDAYQVVNVRGQVNSAYAPAQAQDFMDWLLAVSPTWSIQTLPITGSQNEVIVEEFNVYQFQSAYARSSFVAYLARLLHQGSITILMRTIEGAEGTRKLAIEILERNHAVVLVFTSNEAMFDINDYVLKDNSLVELSGDVHNAVVNPYQVAAVMRRNSSTMGEPRCFKGISVQCGALIGRNGTVENILPLTQAMLVLENTILNNLVEYGFKMLAQLRMLALIKAEVMAEVLRAGCSGVLQAGENFHLSVDYLFLDDDRSGHESTPWCRTTVTVTPIHAIYEDYTRQ